MDVVSPSLFLIPASMAPLTHIYAGEDSLLACYSDGRARLWDLKTREHWRTMTLEKAEEMVKSGGRNIWYIDISSRFFTRILIRTAGGVKVRNIVRSKHCHHFLEAAIVPTPVRKYCPLSQYHVTERTLTNSCHCCD